MGSLLVGTIHRQARVRCQLATLESWQSYRREFASTLLLVDVNCVEPAQLDDLLMLVCQEEGQVQLALLNVRKNDWPEDRVRWSSVNGLFYHDSPRRTLINGIKALLVGEHWLPRNLTQRVLDDLRQPPQSAAMIGISLTPREHETLCLIKRGGSNQEIAEVLHLSPHTVKTHVYNLYRKLGVKNRIEALNWARRYPLP